MNFGSAIKSTKAPCGTKRKNVQVVVRTRPMNDNEREAKNKIIVECDSVSKVINLKTTPQQERHGQGQRVFGPFDKVFGSESTQLQIYNEVVAPLMKEILNGYNCTVFAYGQTGSGKTYTMEGRHDESGEYSWDSDPTSGIIPRALHQIFTELGNDDIDFTVRASYVELYNENIYDLLSRSDNSQLESLRIFDDKTKGVLVAGAEEVIVRSRNEVYELLRRGAEKRRTAATLMNITSSRSHSVFTVTIMIRESGLVNGEELLRQGKLNLVDLAGSENIGRSGATEKRAREAGNINTSLLALGRVINALTINSQHIPYRESKLTRILQDSLGGKTITTIIATISPASSNFEESVNTLEYAQRAKNIKNNPEVNQKITRRGLLKEYNEEIERLRRDLLAAREKHGIYLDKENYDQMVGTIEEKTTKVDELESQLLGLTQQLKKHIEDFDIIDAHYKSAYNKCRVAFEKLAERKRELEVLQKDLARANDNLKAADRALNLSENSFVRLRSQAHKFQTTCADYSRDLATLHDKMDSMAQVFTYNRNLWDELVGEQINRFDKGKEQLSAFSNSANDCIEKVMSNANQMKELASSMVSLMSSVLGESTNELHNFAENKLQMVRKTGTTPARLQTNSFMEEIVDLPPARMLFEEQRQLVTPRRTSCFKARDSILDSSEFCSSLLSPATLKSNLPSQKMEVKLDSVEEEKSQLLGSSMQSSKEDGAK